MTAMHGIGGDDSHRGRADWSELIACADGAVQDSRQLIVRGRRACRDIRVIVEESMALISSSVALLRSPEVPVRPRHRAAAWLGVVAANEAGIEPRHDEASSEDRPGRSGHGGPWCSATQQRRDDSGLSILDACRHVLEDLRAVDGLLRVDTSDAWVREAALQARSSLECLELRAVEVADAPTRAALTARLRNIRAHIDALHATLR